MNSETHAFPMMTFYEYRKKIRKSFYDCESTTDGITSKEPEISPSRKRAMEMKASEIRGLSIAAYPERAAVIKATRMKANFSDSEDYVSLVEMIVALWEADGDGVEDELI